MTRWIFLYACVTFACAKEPPAIEGDRRYYASHKLCTDAAEDFARRHHINIRRREIVCVEREPEE